MRRVSYMNESYLMRECVMSHIRMSHVSHVNEPWHIYTCQQTQFHGSHAHESCLTHVSHVNESWHTYTYANTGYGCVRGGGSVCGRRWEEKKGAGKYKYVYIYMLICTFMNIYVYTNDIYLHICIYAYICMFM